MLRNTLFKTLRDYRRSFFWWSVGLVVTALYMALFYPTIRDQATALADYMKVLPEALMASFGITKGADMYSAEGYLSSYLFAFMVPMLFLILGIGFGASAIAGEEERGTLDLLLANPLPRWRVVLEKFGAFVIYAAALAFVFWLGLVGGAEMVAMPVSYGRMAAATVSSVLPALAFGSLALALGCATGSKGLSIGVSSAVGVAAYFLNSLASVVQDLEPYRKLSPLYYYNSTDPLKHGLSLGNSAVLVGLALVFLAIALYTFQRRDLAV